MNDQLRLETIQSEMTDLFELKRGSGMYRNCVEFKCLSGRGSDWKAFPGTYSYLNDRGEHVGYLKPAKEGYRRVCAYLGKQKRFSAAASPRQFKNTRHISGEWDLNGLQTPADEMVLDYLLNDDLNQLVSKDLTIHWRFSGNRSIYFDIFTGGRIKKATTARLLNCLKHLIDPKCFDKSNQDQSLRLPLSRHYENDNLCRYYGCHTLEENLNYLQGIERDRIDDRMMNQLCRRLETYLGMKHKRGHRVKHEAGGASCKCEASDTTSSPKVALEVDVNTLGIGSLVTLQEQWIQRLRTRPFLVNHPRRAEFIAYLHAGIPEGCFNQVVFGGKYEFQKFVVVMVGVKEEAHEFLRQLACLNIQDRKRIKNRLGRIDYIFKKFYQGWQDCDASYTTPGQLRSFDWLETFIDRFRHKAYAVLKDRRSVNNLIQVLQYCLLLLCRHPEGATIAVSDVQRKVKISHQTAVRHLNLLKTEFPVLTVKTRHNRKLRLATDYVLNEEYIESVLGYSIRTELALAA